MKNLTVMTLILLLSLFISMVFVESTYGTGEHAAILSLCLSCAVFAGIGVVGSALHDHYPMSFLDVVSYLVILFCLTGFIAGFITGAYLMVIMSTVGIATLAGLKSLYIEIKSVI